MNIHNILQRENILLFLDVNTKDEVLNILAKQLYLNHKITNLPRFINDLYERESLGFTGIGKKIAIPHGISTTVKQVSLAIGRLNKKINWENCDHVEQKDNGVELVILFAIPEKDIDKENRDYIEAMKIVMRKLSEPEILHKLLHAVSVNEIIDTLSNE